MGVIDLSLSECLANSTPSKARVVIALTSFNDGSSTGPSDRTGDYNASVQAFRRSDSGDPVGTLRVEGQVTRCEDSTCSTEQQIVAPTNVGALVTVGTTFTMRLIWDAANHRFLAGISPRPDVALSYAANDGTRAVRPSAGILISNSTATCTAHSTEADLSIGLGQVRTNSPSAPPPATPPTPPTTPPTPPTPPSPPTPPTPPPPPPPPPSPPEDHSPFQFPPQPAFPGFNDPSVRYVTLGVDPATGGFFYGGLSVYPNPLPFSHLYAGNRPDGMRLWVPTGAQPAAIRRVLRGERL